MIMVVVLVCAVIAAGITVTGLASWIREARQHGGFRNWCAEAMAAAFGPAPPETPWWEETGEGSLRPLAPQPGTKKDRLPYAWEPVIRPDVGEPPWGDVTRIDGVPLFKGEPS